MKKIVVFISLFSIFLGGLFFWTKERSRFDVLREKIDQYFIQNERDVSEQTYAYLGDILTKQNVIGLLEEAIHDEDRLEQMLQDSQFHPLGFQKIMLMHDWGNLNWELRLHIWWPKNNDSSQMVMQDVVEARHVHLFSFASRVLQGSLEDFRYAVSPLSSQEKDLYRNFSEYLSSLGKEERLAVYRAFDALELSQGLPSHLWAAIRTKEAAWTQTQGLKILRTMPFSEEELKQIQVFYAKVFPIYFDEEGKQDALTLEYKLLPEPVRNYRAGDFYFFPAPFAHRLYVDPDVLTSTIFIAGEFHKGRSSGAFARTDFEVEDDQLPNSQRIPFTKKSLRETLVRYLEKLRS